MKSKLILFVALIASTFFFTQIASATSVKQQVDIVLAEKEAPVGVVIEIVTGASNSLKWALPMAQKQIKILRNRFPDLAISIVTHGSEQFSLQTKKNKKYKKVHSITQQLVNKEEVPVHVCGTYASWNDVAKEEFPDYVDVTAAGPATINDYVSLGYMLIKL